MYSPAFYRLAGSLVQTQCFLDTASVQLLHLIFPLGHIEVEFSQTALFLKEMSIKHLSEKTEEEPSKLDTKGKNISEYTKKVLKTDWLWEMTKRI